MQKNSSSFWDLRVHYRWWRQFSIKLGTYLKGPILSGFLWAVPSLCVLNSGLSTVPFFGTPNIPFFSKIVIIRHLWQCIWKFNSSKSVRKHPQVWDIHQSTANRSESERKKEVRRLVSISLECDCQRDERMYEEKSVSQLSEFGYYHYCNVRKT
jgi:hypothetical protein